MATERLTQKAVERLVKNPPLEGKRQVIVWDTANPGFGLLLSKDRASFVAQGKLHGRSIRRVVGPVGLYTPQTALERANELRRQLYEGKDPAEEARRLKNSRMTLRQARDRHVELMRLKECSERSTGTLISDTDRHLAHWLNRDVRAITEAEVRELVEGLVKKAGKYQAHRTFAQLRAIYNTAIDEIGVHNDPPPNPASRAAGKVLPKTQRKRSPIPWAQLPAWDASVRELPNPIVADFLRFVLYTGLRRADAACVRWDEIDGTEWTIHRPRPKGGVDRAFTVPVSNTVIEILERRRQQNPASPWVFPREPVGERTHRGAPERAGTQLPPAPRHLHDRRARGQGGLGRHQGADQPHAAGRRCHGGIHPARGRAPAACGQPHRPAADGAVGCDGAPSGPRRG